jgi:hypothetical protein
MTDRHIALLTSWTFRADKKPRAWPSVGLSTRLGQEQAVSLVGSAVEHAPSAGTDVIPDYCTDFTLRNVTAEQFPVL